MGLSVDLSRVQGYLEWLKTKVYLDYNSIRARGRRVKRGEVYRCNLGKGVGSEECKERPCVIIQYDAGNAYSPNTIVAPITHSSSNLPIVVKIEDKKDSSGKVILDGNVLLGNIVCVSKGRLGELITKLDDNEMKKVDEAIAISLGIKYYYDKLFNIYNDKLDYIKKLKDKENYIIEDLNEINNLKKKLGVSNTKELVEKINLMLD